MMMIITKVIIILISIKIIMKMTKNLNDLIMYLNFYLQRALSMT